MAQQGYNALHGILLDMYSDKPICKTEYSSGADTLSSASYFDSDTHYTKRTPLTSQKFTFWGGVRKRIFGFSPCLSKIPLFQFNTNISLLAGTHFVNNAKMADICAAILHFKYFSNFYASIEEEIKRKEHWDNAREYKAYAKILDQPDLSFYYDKSVRFTDSQQLIDLGIMKDSLAMRDFAESLLEC